MGCYIQKNLQPRYSKLVHLQPHCSWLQTWFKLFYYSLDPFLFPLTLFSHISLSLSLSLSLSVCVFFSLFSVSQSIFLRLSWRVWSSGDWRGECGFVEIDMESVVVSMVGGFNGSWWWWRCRLWWFLWWVGLLWRSVLVMVVPMVGGFDGRGFGGFLWYSAVVDCGLGWQVLVDFVGFVVCCDVWRCCGGGSVGLV